MTDVVLKVDSVSKTYQQGSFQVPVLREVSFEVQRGEQIAIVGASGSGKSTLLHLLGGLDTPSSGQVMIDGQNLAQLNEVQRGQLRNQKVGFVYQFHHLLPEFTALENVMMPLIIRRVATKLSRDKASTLLEQVGLAHRFDHKPAELSGGERQRAAIARALIIEPVCLLADEPTGNIDRQNAKNIQDLMTNLDREFAVSLVVATHDLELAASIDRVLTLENGHINRC